MKEEFRDSREGVEGGKETSENPRRRRHVEPRVTESESGGVGE